MEQIVNKIFEIELDEIETYNFPLNELFGLKVIHNNTKYCFLVRFSTENDKMICIGSGAQVRTEKSFDRPVFQRHSWHSEFNASVIYYSDPIYLESNSAMCGWCVGTPDEYYLDYIKKVIEKLSKNHKIKNENMLFYGSSAGGFTSIQLGTYFKDSVVLANNPQTDIRYYNEIHYNKLMEVCFKNMSREEVEKQFEYRINVISTFKKEKYIPNIYYILELYSDIDFDKHLTPFLFNLRSLDFFNKSNSVQVMFYYETGNHNPLNKKDTIKLINHVSNGDFISLNNIYNLEIDNGITLSVPPNFEDARIPTANKIKFINEKNEEILIHEYSKNNALSEKNFNNQIASLKENNHLIFVEDSFIINKTKVFMLKFQDTSGTRTFFYFDRYDNSYLAVFYNFTSVYNEIELIKDIINNMKKEKVFN